jgi:mRNA degradation ribonuclease J1/J2
LAIRQDIRRTVSKLFQQKTGRRVMVVPVIMQI